jgi:thiosulfate/3-mercaptopyruvate sulfurtransferase
LGCAFQPVPAAGRNGKVEFKQKRIPGSQFFDIGGVADTTKPLPHMVPSEAAFSAAASALGVGPQDMVVIYDRMGTFSAPRAWWTWKIFGHKRCAATANGAALR